MATSGTTTFNMTRDELIRSAFEIIGVTTANEPLEAEEVQVAQVAFNAMIKAYQAHGMQLWKRGYVSVPLVAGQADYDLGPASATPMVRPIRIQEANRVDTSSSISVTMNRMSLQEYYNLPNRVTQGIPINFYFEPQLTNSIMKLWLVPDTNAAATYTIDLVCQSAIEDVTSGTDDLDFPQEWYEPLINGLAYRLAPRYGLGVKEREFLKIDMDDSLELAMSFDSEDTSVFFQKDTTRNT